MAWYSNDALLWVVPSLPISQIESLHFIAAADAMTPSVHTNDLHPYQQHHPPERLFAAWVTSQHHSWVHGCAIRRQALRGPVIQAVLRGQAGCRARALGLKEVQKRGEGLGVRHTHPCFVSVTHSSSKCKAETS